MLRKILFSLSLCVILLAAGYSYAEDIDIFRPPESSGAVGAPNVLFVIDTAASWSSTLDKDNTKEEAVLESLHDVIMVDEFYNKVNLGLMVFSHSNNTRGGTVLVNVDPLNEEHRKKISCRIYKTSLDAQGVCPAVKGEEGIVKGNNAPYATSLNEAYLYFSGKKPRSGLEDGEFSDLNRRGYDPVAISAGVYNSPAKDNPCANNFIIVIGTGTPDSGEDTQAKNVLTALGGVDPVNDPIKLDPSNFQGSWGDEFARFLRSADLGFDVEGSKSIKTYVIHVHEEGDKHPRFPAAEAFYQSMAKEGGGTYYSVTNRTQVALAISKILEEVQSVNTMFASVSLPISVNVQGANANQVYVGMFRPDSTLTPRWVGNIKRYEYLFNNQGEPYLADMNGNPAYNPVTGFIALSAVSFWTEASNYWAFLADPINPDPSFNPSDSPDGNIVEKGAAAQRLRERAANDPRNLLACIAPCEGLASYGKFDSANTAVSSKLSESIVKWVYGHDMRGEAQSVSDPSEIDESIRRPSIHGDVLHSRPAVVNYNRYENGDNDVILFYGSNDGIFRAVEGATGKELWGLILDKHFGLLDRMYNNKEPVDGEPWRPYAVDGNPTVISLDFPHPEHGKDGKLIAADGDKVYLYLTMRRGGSIIHAIDISTPDDPKPMWYKDNTSPGYGELGQTWSAPVAAYINHLGMETPVLIFGLGYDADFEDKTSYLPSDGPGKFGRGIMVVNALTGDPIWQAGPSPSGATYNKTVSDMTFSIPSEVRLVNRSGSNVKIAEYIYVGDTGGNIWKVDIRDKNPGNWEVSKLASVGGCTNKVQCRKFLYPPSIVFGDDYDAVLIGSGDREKPHSVAITDRFYMFKDQKSTTPIVESAMLDVTNTPTDVDGAALDTALGWFFTLGKGEKVVGNPLTLEGTTIFYTNQPRAPDIKVTSCVGNLGTARRYAVNYLDGSAPAGRSVELPGGGLPPGPQSMTLKDPTGRYWTGESGLKPETPSGGGYGHRTRTFWFKDAD